MDLKTQSHGSLHRLSHLCFHSCICCFVIRGTTPYKSLSHQVRNYEGRWRPSLPFLENHKKCSGFGKKDPYFVDPEVKFTIQNIVLRDLGQKAPKFSAVGLFILDFLRKYLSKCSNFKTPPLPWTISGCAPAYIWYKQSDFCSLELYWQYLQKSWWSSGMIPEKVTWVRLPARIDTVYGELPPINDLF